MASSVAMVVATRSIGLARASSAGASTQCRRWCLKNRVARKNDAVQNKHHARRLFGALAVAAITSIALAGLAFATGAFLASAFAAITARGFRRRGERARDASKAGAKNGKKKCFHKSLS